jgi:hypothetical protein
MSKKQDKKHKEYTVVYCTKDYSWFKKTKGNRPSRASHYKKIKNSIVEKDLKMVLYVNSDGTIREGHNTFEVRKELNLPIYYIINDDMTALDVPRFNSSRDGWSYSNTVNFYAVRGRKPYLIVKEKMQQYNMPIQETVGLLKGVTTISSETAEEFKWGGLTISDEELETFDTIAGTIRKLYDIRYNGEKLRRGFIRTIFIAYKKANFTVERARTAIKKSGAKLDGCRSTEDYINTLGKIYDSGLEKSKRLNLSRFFEDKTYEKKEGESIH